MKGVKHYIGDDLAIRAHGFRVWELRGGRCWIDDAADLIAGEFATLLRAYAKFQAEFGDGPR